jgi:hypothetical protein
MKPFLAAPVHRAAMSHLEQFAGRAKFARFTSERRRVSWRHAFAHLKDADGVWTRKGGYSKAA